MSKILQKLSTLITFVLIIGFIPNTYAQLSLNNKQSYVHFISLKNDSILEVHQIEKLSGSIDKDGNAVITIDMNSIDTDIGIRNSRMRKLLLETKMYPTATLSTSVKLKKLSRLTTGEQTTLPVKFLLNLHGQQKKIKTKVEVTALAGNKLSVSTIKPVVLELSDFKLLEGINALREVANLKSISPSTLVTAKLIFEPSSSR